MKISGFFLLALNAFSLNDTLSKDTLSKLSFNYSTVTTDSTLLGVLVD